jgi:fatty-acyl-CoA synthase
MMSSEVVGAREPRADRCVSEVLAMTARRLPDKVGIVSLHQDVRMTWSQVHRRVDMLASGLLSIGLLPQDRIGIWSCNCVEWVCLQFAAARIGVVLVNLNPALRELDLAFVLRQARMRVLFLQAGEGRGSHQEVLERSGASGSVEQVVVLGSRRWQELANSEVALPLLSTSVDDVVNVQYTSGSTGNPKGVMLTHRNVVSNALALAKALQIGDEDVLCGQVPMHHCFGYVVSSLLCAASGMTLVFPAARFSPRASLEAISSERCSVIHGVPTMFSACLQHPEFSKFDLSSLRTGIMAGAPCPVELVKRVIGEMRCSRLTVAYGQTETSPAVTISDADVAVELRSETVGRVMANTEIRLVGANGTVVPVGEVGEIVVRGDCVMHGYDLDAAATASAINAEGWLRTGDLAAMRGDGYLSIKGRLTDMIIRGGENVYPKEVEDVISSHPSVAECCVVGVPDEHFGEAVLAWVRLRSECVLSSDELTVYCARKIARFKTPSDIRWVDELPLTSNGKIDRKRIRQFEVDARGLQDLARVRTA